MKQLTLRAIDAERAAILSRVAKDNARLHELIVERQNIIMSED